MNASRRDPYTRNPATHQRERPGTRRVAHPRPARTPGPSRHDPDTGAEPHGDRPGVIDFDTRPA
jgi:hypothetical protein